VTLIFRALSKQLHSNYHDPRCSQSGINIDPAIMVLKRIIIIIIIFSYYVQGTSLSILDLKNP
jgi:hypothetical protein